MPAYFYLALIYGLVTYGFILPNNNSFVFLVLYAIPILIKYVSSKKINWIDILITCFLLICSVYNIPNIIYSVSSNAFLQMLFITFQMLITIVALPIYFFKKPKQL